MALSIERRAEIVKQFGKNEKDTGSIQVQIALLTAQINELTKHLKANKKDASGQRGLFKLIGQRRGLLDYLNRTEDEEDGYTNLVDKSLQTTRRFDALKVWMSFLIILFFSSSFRFF